MYDVMNGTHKTQYWDHKMEPSADSRAFPSKSSFCAAGNNACDARGGGHCSGGDDADDEATKMATQSQLLWPILPTLLAVLALLNTCHGLLFLIWFSSGVFHLCFACILLRSIPFCYTSSVLFSGISWFFFVPFILTLSGFVRPAELISHLSFSWVLIKDFLWLKIEICVVNMLRSLHLGPAGSMFVAWMWPEHLTRGVRETTDRILPTILAVFWGHFFRFRILMRSTHESRSGHSRGEWGGCVCVCENTAN